MNEVYIQLKKLRTLNKKSDLNNRDNFGHLKYKNLISSKFKLKNLIKTKTNEILQMYLNVTFSSANNENSIGKKSNSTNLACKFTISILTPYLANQLVNQLIQAITQKFYNAANLHSSCTKYEV